MKSLAIFLGFSILFTVSCSTLAIEENAVDDVVTTDDFQAPEVEQDQTSDESDVPDAAAVPDEVLIDNNVVINDSVEVPDEEEEEEEEEEIEDAFTLFLKLLAAEK